ncbi:YicC/YloC family endoribonuclease [Candidatus Omnitrophota bacterium]
MRSMTGFASHTCSVGGVKATIELKSVNHRYLDIYVKVPRALASFEVEMRKSIQKSSSRGKITFAITCDNFIRDEVVLNKELLASVICSLQKIRKQYTFLEDIQTGDLLKVPNLFTFGENKQISRVVWKDLKSEIETVLSKFIETREKEGRQLERDIRKRLQIIKSTVLLIDKERKVFIKNCRTKMLGRIHALMDDVSINEDRLMKEVAFLLEKVDISEEIVRLKSHHKLFLSFLAKKEKFGKDLDFITQEMNREVNTIGSKAQDAAISHFVIKIKSEIEKIREQLQNVE